jgi:hypothetical protein
MKPRAKGSFAVHAPKAVGGWRTSCECVGHDAAMTVKQGSSEPHQPAFRRLTYSAVPHKVCGAVSGKDQPSTEPGLNDAGDRISPALAPGQLAAGSLALLYRARQAAACAGATYRRRESGRRKIIGRRNIGRRWPRQRYDRHFRRRWGEAVRERRSEHVARNGRS